MAKKEKKAGGEETNESGREKQGLLREADAKVESLKEEAKEVKKDESRAVRGGGFRVDFIPFEHFSMKNNEEKLKLIIDRTKETIIVVIEGVLTPEEEAKLIQETMSSIDTESYFGIEFYRIERKDDSLREKLASMLSKRRGGLTIVGPKKIVEEIKREPEYISVLAKAGE